MHISGSVTMATEAPLSSRNSGFSRVLVGTDALYASLDKTMFCDGEGRTLSSLQVDGMVQLHGSTRGDLVL